ncbi:MAG: hypothetical protein Q9207_001538 [Kuettlingeria erythrocarpa]
MSSTSSRSLNLFLFAFVLFHARLCSALYPVQQIYQWPNNTVAQNLAVRPDGSILTTQVVPTPELFLIQPNAQKPNPQLLYRFNASAVTGITETSPDVFHVTVATVTSTNNIYRPVANGSQLWRVTFPRRNSNKPQLKKIATLPEVRIPNGLTSTAAGNRLISADTNAGLIFTIETATGAVVAALSDPLFVPNQRVPFGVNGVRITGSTLYFTNGAQNVFGKIAIDPVTGIAQNSTASVVSRALPPSRGYDDFALSPSGNVAFVANPGGGFIERVDLRTGQQEIVAGQINSTEIAQPTSAAFGRRGNKRVLFVTTEGGFSQPINGKVVGGQLLAIKVPKSAL